MNRRNFVLGTVGAAALSGARNLGNRATNPNTLVVDASGTPSAPVISRLIYGHFAEHLGRLMYDGIWVGEGSPIPNTRGMRTDIIEALRAIRVPVVRWPGGCYADKYHWKDGVGPRPNRPEYRRGFVDTNHFGTHEFMDFCELVGCEPFLCGNVGSGDVRESVEWVEYVTASDKRPMADMRRKNGREEPWKLKYLAIGNENWGCGGNMTAEYYSDLYNQFATFLPGNLNKVACGLENSVWMETLLKKCARRMQGISLHHYITAGTWREKGSATEFDEQGWFTVVKRAADMDGVVRKYAAIMDEADPQKRIGIVYDEWGTWFDPGPGARQGSLYQQNTIRDAVLAGVVLNVFNWHCDRISMANIAQVVNVLQAMILTDGPRMVLTPTYHVFEMYKVHHDARLLPCTLKCGSYSMGQETTSALHVSASRDEAGRIHLSVCNLDHSQPQPIFVEFAGARVSSVSGRVLTAAAINAHNTFDSPDVVKPMPFTNAAISNGTLKAEFPAKSVTVLDIG